MASTARNNIYYKLHSKHKQNYTTPDMLVNVQAASAKPTFLLP